MRIEAKRLIGAAFAVALLGSAVVGARALVKEIQDESVVSASSDMLKGPGYRVRRLASDSNSISVLAEGYNTWASPNQDPTTALNEALRRFYESCGPVTRLGPENWSTETGINSIEAAALYSPKPDCFPVNN